MKSKFFTSNLFLFYFFGFLFFSLFIDFGNLSADTKLDLYFSPLDFLKKALNLWNSNLTLGQVQNQAYGYFFPQGLLFSCLNFLNIPMWFAQRIWWSIVLTTGVFGFSFLLKSLGYKNRKLNLIVGLIFICSPHFLGSLTSISSEIWPIMLAPWLLGIVAETINNSRTSNIQKKFAWKYYLIQSFKFAFIVGLIGGINASASLLTILPAFLWFLYFIFQKKIKTNRKYLLLFCITSFLFSLLVSLWWLVPLVILGKVSPNFLNYIESAEVTNRWNSLAEVLRGSVNWTNYVSNQSTLGNFFVSNWILIFANSLIVILGLVGLYKLNNQSKKPLLILFFFGIIVFSLGYSGRISSPLNAIWLDSLDTFFSMFRNVHKFDALVRIPLIVGVAIFLYGIKEKNIFKIKYNFISLKSLFPALIFGIISLSVFSQGFLTKNSFKIIPNYWNETSNWIFEKTKLENSNFHSRVLVIPGSSFANQIWGYTRDEPLQPFLNSPWAVRDSIPLVPEGGIRMLDNIQTELTFGKISNRFADYLASQGFSHIVFKLDQESETDSYIDEKAMHIALLNSKKFSLVKVFGKIPKTKQNKISNTDSAVEIFKINSSIKTTPYLFEKNKIPILYGSGESALEYMEYFPNYSGPLIFSKPKQGKDYFKNEIFLTDTPKLRETNYGKSLLNKSGVREKDFKKSISNKVYDYKTEVDPAFLEWKDAVVTVSSSADDAAQLGKINKFSGIKGALDGDLDTSWVSGKLSGSIGQWIDLKLKKPQNNLSLNLTLGETLGAQVNQIQIKTNNGTFIKNIEPKKLTKINLPSGITSWIRITATGIEKNKIGIQFAISELRVIDLQKNKPLDLMPNVVIPKGEFSKISGLFLRTDYKIRENCLLENKKYFCDINLFEKSEENRQINRSFYFPNDEIFSTEFKYELNRISLQNIEKSESEIMVFGENNISDNRGNLQALIDNDIKTIWNYKNIQNLVEPKLSFYFKDSKKINKIKLNLVSEHNYIKPKKIAINYGKGREIFDLNKTNEILLDESFKKKIILTILEWDFEGNDETNYPQSINTAISGIDFYEKNKLVTNNNNSFNESLFDCASKQMPKININGTTFSTKLQKTSQNSPLNLKICDLKDNRVDFKKGWNNISISNIELVNINSVFFGNKHDSALKQSDIKIVDWQKSKRKLNMESAISDQILVIPEAFNESWQACDQFGNKLIPQVINDWQQGWIIPKGTAGYINLEFKANSIYNKVIIFGLLLALVLMLIFLLIILKTKNSKINESLKDNMYSNIMLSEVKSLKTATINSIFLLIIFTLLFGIAGLLTFLSYIFADNIFKFKQNGKIILIVFSSLISYLFLIRNPWISTSRYFENNFYSQIFLIFCLSIIVDSICPFVTKTAKKVFNNKEINPSNNN